MDDETIANLKSAVAAKRQEAEEAAQAWQRAARDFLEARYKHEVEKAVTKDRPQRAQELGRDGLAALKTELGHLVDDLDTIVRDELNADALWAHRGDIRPDDYGSYGHRLHNTPLEEPVRRAIGRVAPLLVERGLADRDDWQRHGEFAWRYALDQSEEMALRTQEYNVALKELRQLQRDLDAAMTAKEQSAARSLWDDA